MSDEKHWEVTIIPMGGQPRRVVVRPGMRVRIVPPNPAKKRNRDRIAEVVGVRGRRVHESAGDEYVDVRFLDTGRRGRADFDEIVPLDEEPAGE